MGTGGAFVGRADDPSSLFFNEAGMAFVEKKLSLGISTSTLNDLLFQGLPPGFAAGTTAEQDSSVTVGGHAYLLQPLSKKLVAGLGIYQPFGFENRWKSPSTFSGRAISTDSELTTFDLKGALAYKVHPKVSLGAALLWRSAEIKHSRRVQTVNPFSGTLLDFGSFAIDTSLESEVGWSASVFIKPSDSLGLGISHRSAVDIQFGAAGRLTQLPTGNEQLDVLIGASLPFDEDLPATTSLDLPSETVLGLAIGVGSRFRLLVDVSQMEWSSIQNVDVSVLTQPALDRGFRLEMEDTTDVRVGLTFTTLGGAEFRTGVALEESPLPDRNVGPFYVDTDAMLFTLGFGKDWLDLAFQWREFDPRRVVSSVDFFNGNYRGTEWIFGMTVTP